MFGIDFIFILIIWSRISFLVGIVLISITTDTRSVVIINHHHNHWHQEHHDHHGGDQVLLGLLCCSAGIGFHFWRQEQARSFLITLIVVKYHGLHSFFLFLRVHWLISFNTSSSWTKKNDPQSGDDSAWGSQYAFPTGHIFPRRWARQSSSSSSSFSSSSSIIEIHSAASFLSAFTLLGLPAEVYTQVTYYDIIVFVREIQPSPIWSISLYWWDSANTLNNDNLQGTQFLSVVAFTPITAFVLISTFLPIFHNLQVLLKGEKNLTSILYRMFW